MSQTGWDQDDADRFVRELQRSLGKGAWDLMSPQLRSHAVDSHILRTIMSVRQPVDPSDVRELRGWMRTYAGLEDE